MTHEKDETGPPINGSGADGHDARADHAAELEAQPLPGEVPPQPEEPKRPVLEIDDEHAEKLAACLGAALPLLRLFEGAVVTNRVSMRSLEGPLAYTVAAQLVQVMRGVTPRQYNVRKTLRDLFRGIPMPPQAEQSLYGLHPNAAPFGTEFTVNDDDGTPAATVEFKVEMIPTIVLPGPGSARPRRQ